MGVLRILSVFKLISRYINLNVRQAVADCYAKKRRGERRLRYYIIVNKRILGVIFFD